MDKKTISTSLRLIKESIWNTQVPDISLDNNAEEVFRFFQEHAITAIVGDSINKISIPEKVREKWKKCIFQQLYTYHNYVYAQECILKRLKENGISVVVLKGTSAAQYYPRPEYRAVGDIDLLVRQKEFYRAKDVILSNGYIESNPEETIDRHITLVKDRFSIELHWRFASENVIDDPAAFDEILFADISPDRFALQPTANGLVLLEHIAQHLNGGLGLRQILDWMLYVSSYLHDEVWRKDFCLLAEKAGLKSLAISVTRMCQLYLGLTEYDIKWCCNADKKTCHDLMDYIVHCGSFGHSRSIFDSGAITKIPSLKHPILFFRYVQRHGEISWKLAHKHRVAKPFAWIYQSVKYLRMIGESNADSDRVKKMYMEAEKRRQMFNKLGIHIKQV